MRQRRNVMTVLAATACVISGCAAMKGGSAKHPTPLPEEATPVVIPTVPARTPTPIGGAPLPTRPLVNPDTDKQRKAGKQVGPLVTHAGIARADGRPVEPTGTKNGIPVYLNQVGSGFMIVIEGKPGFSNIEVGRRILVYDPNDPSKRPDLEVELSNPLGDGSEAVCDQRRPNIGGIPAINPPDFSETKQVAAALNDMSCRFETFIESAGSCTLNKFGDFSFVNKDSHVQFCMVVAKAWNFPKGDTLVSVRLRDSAGNPGPVGNFYLRRPEKAPTPKPAAQATPEPTVSHRRP